MTSTQVRLRFATHLRRYTLPLFALHGRDVVHNPSEVVAAEAVAR